MLWPSITAPDCWEQPVTGLVSEEVLLAVPVPPALLRAYYFNPDVENHFFENKDDRWRLVDGARVPIDSFYGAFCENLRDDPAREIFRANDNFQAFINSLWNCRGMALFAQREYVNREFSDFNQLDDVLEDTNAPWDWDHIYPSSWVYGKHNIPPIIKDWNWCIGNLRALALEHNRSESNQLSPAERLNDLPDSAPPDCGPPRTGEVVVRRESFINDNCTDTWNDWQYWKDIKERIGHDSGRDAILRHYHAVAARMLNIYRRWWSDLRIGEALGCPE